MRRIIVRLLFLAAVLTPIAARAQYAPRPALDWRTVSTRHFDFHYPREMEAWTLHVAARMDSVYGAVRALVGYAPGERVTVVVDDPLSTANGSAWPLLDAPAILLWPTPPDPNSGIGNSRDWGEMLGVHEFAHIAHLTRPSRNARWRRLWSLAPARVSPLVTVPRWAIEGYATHVEGVLTGSGRPHGVVRPAVIRQWALEGKLPSYAQLDATRGPYQQGAMAYLVGSAFLESLAARHGDSSLVHLWRRMSARERRTFPDAFAGVYGGMPWDLYDRWKVDVTARAVEAERALRAAGVAVGDTIQRLEYGTGAPALSPHDSLLAVQLRYRDRPSRIVVWQTAPDTAAERRAAEARRRLLERDPEDVPAVRWRPSPRRALATLRPVAGRAHEAPRWFADGRRILVHRLEPLGDGSWRPDLFVWDWGHRTLTRVTHGAGVRDGDPSPDGASAVAQRCAGGVCDIVRVDIATGRVTVLVPGTVEQPWSRPRWSPDGRTIVAARKMEDRWRLVVVPADRPEGARAVGPDDGASRYDASFTRDGGVLVYTSEASGIANLEMLDLASGAARPMTRVTGAALAAAPTHDGSAVYYLSLHARGLDLARIGLLQAPLDLAPLDTALAPVARVAGATRDGFPADAVSAPHDYGVGPRRQRIYPVSAVGAEGGYGALVLASTDPVGRLTWLLQGAYGERGTWRGAALGAAWRGSRPTLSGDAWYAEQRPSRQGEGALPPSPLDADYAGAAVALALAHDGGGRQWRARGAVSSGDLAPADGDRGARSLALVELAGALSERGDRDAASMALALHGAAGRTLGEGWWRGVGALDLRAELHGWRLHGSATYGQTARDAPPYERMTAGGLPSPLFDASLLSQRVSHPALPVGFASGRQLMVARAGVELAGLEAYLWTASGGETLGRWRRVAAAEWRIGSAPLPLVHLPTASVLLGVGHSIDAPLRRETRGYAVVRVRP